MSDIREIENSLHACGTERTLLKLQEKWVFIVSYSTRLTYKCSGRVQSTERPGMPQALTLTSCTGLEELIEANVEQTERKSSTFSVLCRLLLPRDRGDQVSSLDYYMLPNFVQNETLAVKWRNRKKILPNISMLLVTFVIVL